MVKGKCCQRTHSSEIDDKCSNHNCIHQSILSNDIGRNFFDKIYEFSTILLVHRKNVIDGWLQVLIESLSNWKNQINDIQSIILIW